MFNYNEWIDVVDPKTLREYFDNALNKSGFNIVSYTEKHFEPHGFTSLYLLSESHFAIHTFPEEGKSYIEISSCIYNPFLNFKKILKQNGI